jgi:hypothetical protein
MRTALVRAATGATAALALISSDAQASGGGKHAAACSNQTVAIFGKATTLRFVLHGVSCDKGHSLIRTYFHDIATKTCGGRGTTCIFEYPGGWDCSSPPPSFPTSASHRFAVCEPVPGRPVASVTVYRVTRKPGARRSEASLWSALDAKVICGLGIHASSQPDVLLCFDRAIPSPRHTNRADGDPGFAFLAASGPPDPVRLSQYSWQQQNGYEPSGRTALGTGQTWHRPGLGVTCTIGATSVRCVNASHNGFTLTQRTYHSS